MLALVLSKKIRQSQNKDLSNRFIDIILFFRSLDLVVYQFLLSRDKLRLTVWGWGNPYILTLYNDMSSWTLGQIAVAYDILTTKTTLEK